MRAFSALMGLATTVALFHGAPWGPEGPHEITLEEVLVLGADESLPTEYLLGMPWQVAAMADGPIYIADRSILGVRAFSREGTYLRTIGSRGRGPGEFRDLTAMSLLGDGLLVADGSNKRVTGFSAEGRVIWDAPMDVRDMVYPRRVRASPEGELVFLYKLPGAVEGRGVVNADSNALFHIYDAPMGSKTRVLGRWDSVLGSGPLVDVLSSFAPGNFDISADGDIVYAPTVPTGDLFVFDGGTGEARTIRGRRWDSPGYTEHDPEAPRVPGVEYFRGKETHALAIHRISAGVFFVRGGRIVHFVHTVAGGQGQLSVEVYSKEGVLEASDVVMENVPAGPSVAPPVSVSWKDSDDLFYVIDNREVPVVRVCRLLIS